jgi:hypothetical protein
MVAEDGYHLMPVALQLKGQIPREKREKTVPRLYLKTTSCTAASVSDIFEDWNFLGLSYCNQKWEGSIILTGTYFKCSLAKRKKKKLKKIF